jgi:formiminotetrahydrofolate cyclodeaminase
LIYKDALKKYLDDLAGRKPAPGGGSAAALSAAMGVSLVSMVANFTIGKDKYQDFEDEAKKILSSSEGLREKLVKLVDEDVKGYEKLSHAYKLPKESCADKEKRTQAIQEGLKQALIAPVEVCKCCHEGIKFCLPLAKKGNLNLITDVGIASMMFQCGFQSALLNVEINLKSIKEERFILEVREILEPMEKELEAVNQQVNIEVDKHLKSRG